MGINATRGTLVRRWRRHHNDKVQSVTSALPLDDDVLSNLPDEQLIAWPDREAAYLTFVYEDGRWKIDVWDDSGS